MAYQADATLSVQQIIVDHITSPVTGDVQVVKLMDGVAGSGTPVGATALGSLKVKEQTSGTAAHTNVAASVTSVALLASTALRVGGSIYNDSASATLSISLAGAASATNFLVQIPAGGYFELPFGWTGLVNGIWSAAVGSARVTEFT